MAISSCRKCIGGRFYRSGMISVVLSYVDSHSLHHDALPRFTPIRPSVDLRYWERNLGTIQFVGTESKDDVMLRVEIHSLNGTTQMVHDIPLQSLIPTDAFDCQLPNETVGIVLTVADAVQNVFPHWIPTHVLMFCIVCGAVGVGGIVMVCVWWSWWLIGRGKR
eukprot:PhF_6_TR8299/c0_g2_i1/m.12785